MIAAAAAVAVQLSARRRAMRQWRSPGRGVAASDDAARRLGAVTAAVGDDVPTAEVAAVGHQPGGVTPAVPPRPPAAVVRPAVPAPTSRAPHARPQALLKWVGAGVKVAAGPLSLRSPLTYFCDSRRGRQVEEPAAIDLALPVAPHGSHPVERELGYWPRYDAMTPVQRRNYLEWMAGGRKVVPPELGYFFVFMYGLERRALVDRDDHRVIFDEVLRLRALYAEGGGPVSRSFDGYTTSFLWFVVVAFPGAVADAQVERLAAGTRVWSEESLSSMLGWAAATGRPLPAWAAYAVADFLPQTARSVVIRRVGTEFRDLFAARYRAQFGAGMALASSKRPLRHAYRPASAAIEPADVTIPNPLGLTSQFKPLVAIWGDCLAELKKLSGVVAKHGASAALTPAGWEALPPELRAGLDHPATAAITDLVGARTREDGRTFVPVADVAAAVGMPVPASGRLPPKQARSLCQTLEWADYCAEPDARLADAGYRGTDTVALFLRTEDAAPDAARYNAAATMLRAGFALAAADGEVHPDEVELLMQQVRRAFDLSAVESRRLEVLRSLLEEEPPAPGALAKTLKGLAAGQREATARLLVALVAADGVVTDGERKSLRRGYAALGLPPDRADADLTRLAAPSAGPAASDDEPVVVAPGRPGPAPQGEAIPPPPAPAAAGLRLDRAAIAAIMNDTRDVARMLAEAMQAETDADADANPARAQATSGPATPVLLPPSVTAGPRASDAAEAEAADVPARYASLYHALLGRTAWELSAAEAVARQHGHMLSGAIEALNEWSFDRHGSQLFVEEDGRLLVESSVLQ